MWTKARSREHLMSFRNQPVPMGWHRYPPYEEWFLTALYDICACPYALSILQIDLVSVFKKYYL